MCLDCGRKSNQTISKQLKLTPRPRYLPVHQPVRLQLDVMRTVILFLCQTLWPVPGCASLQPQGERTESSERNGGLSAHHRQGCAVAFTFSCSSDDECPARAAVMDSSARHSLLPSAILMKRGVWATLLPISPVYGSSLPFTTCRSVVTWQFNRSHFSFLHIIWTYFSVSVSRLKGYWSAAVNKLHILSNIDYLCIN